ncbi:hypothetical protein EWH70_31220 [Amycolatopsis suaedae]|uniref:Uncharacterized protein n=1 Tax=Amycolatopsis suaedae TaxID=2510978 RepID=A0A4Q7J0F4_9PSEU|nr:hypothetical protein EWH70_31220 [Amycolatopsis suaedae]
MVLLLKLFLAPVLVVGSTLAGRRWGPGVAGILVALPVVAGPVLFITFLQHGAEFTAEASAASLLGVVSLAVFAVVFARAARRFAWPVTLAVSWLVVLAVDAGLSWLDVPALAGLGLAVAATVAAMAAMPEREPAGTARPWSRWDLPGRAVATAALVVAVTSASSALGPDWTGLLAPFPVALSVVAGFVHAGGEPAMVARTLAGALTGLFGFSAFCLGVSVLVQPLGGYAFAVSTVAAVATAVLASRLR